MPCVILAGLADTGIALRTQLLPQLRGRFRRLHAVPRPPQPLVATARASRPPRPRPKVCAPDGNHCSLAWFAGLTGPWHRPGGKCNCCNPAKERDFPTFALCSPPSQVAATATAKQVIPMSKPFGSSRGGPHRARFDGGRGARVAPDSQVMPGSRSHPLGAGTPSRCCRRPNPGPRSRDTPSTKAVLYTWPRRRLLVPRITPSPGARVDRFTCPSERQRPRFRTQPAPPNPPPAPPGSPTV